MSGHGRVVLVAFAAGLLGLGASLWWQRASQAPSTATAAPVDVANAGDVLPTLALRDIDGHAVTLPGRFAGQTLLLNFWASWCAPCRSEMPELQRFAAQQGPGGVQVIGIALDDADAVRTFLRATGVGYPILLDTPGRGDSSVRLGDDRGLLPYSVLVRADGRIAKRHLGPFQTGEIARWAQP